MARRKVKTTRQEIIRTALRFFLEKGYSVTSPRMICNELDLSTGNLTYYFPAKDHLLAVLIEMLCDFQREMVRRETDEGNSAIMAICLELMSMAAMCEEDEIVKEIYIAAYTSPLTLGIIRRNDAKRAQTVFAETCSGWTAEQFAEAETLVSGIEYATLATTQDSPPLEMRISGALNQILTIYRIPEETRQAKIDKVLAMDYREIGKRILKEFKVYVETINRQTT